MSAVLTAKRARWLLGVYVVTMLAVVFQPMSGAAIGSVDLGSWLVWRLGLAAVITPAMVEFALNVVLFAPLTFLGSMAARRVVWEQWVGLTLIVSGTIEFVQMEALPGRSASLLDLAANTLGGLLGALMAKHLLRRREQRATIMGCVDDRSVSVNEE